MDYSRRIKRGTLLVTVLALVPFLTSAQTFTNPLGAEATIPGLLGRITTFLLGLVGFIALLSLVWGGVMYIISFGDESGIKRAKAIVVWSIVGLIVIILSFFIVRTVSSILGVTAT